MNFSFWPFLWFGLPGRLPWEKLLILLRDGPCLELIIISSNFQALLLLQEKLLESVWQRLFPVKKSWKLLDPPFLVVRSEMWQNESSPNFSNFCPEFPPEFCSEFSPNFSRSFRALFPRKRRPEKIHQKSPPFFNAKFPGNCEKLIHKMFLESRQSNN